MVLKVNMEGVGETRTEFAGASKYIHQTLFESKRIPSTPNYFRTVINK